MANKKQSFEELRSEWYKKLKDDGFNDIELDDINLKTPSSIFLKYHTKESLEAKASYYQMASNFLEEYKFADKRSQIIWEYHTNGMSIRDITETLNKLPREKKLNRDVIWKVIKAMKVKMFDMYMINKDKEYHE